jgi:sulfite reductase (ferredoxin)
MYILPATLSDDIQRFASLASEYKDKKIESTQFKANRVPMGIYEQRENEVYMSRVRTTGGVISPTQLSGLIDIALRNNSNLLHITTRQEIQLQNLCIDDVEPVLTELQKIGLSTKGGGGNTIRNIIVSEESGISDSEQFDATPYAMDITSKLIAESDSYLLPRKMKLAFSSNDKETGYAAINDLGFVAKTRNGERGFYVYAGGGGGSRPTIGWELFDFVPARNLYAVAEAIKRFFSDYGNRKVKSKARLRFVFYKLGKDETLRLINKYYDEALKTEPGFEYREFENERPPFQYNPNQSLEVDEDTFEVWRERYVTKQKQAGYNSVLVPVLLGNIKLDDEKNLTGLRKLLQFVGTFGNHTLRFTTSQNIRLRNIPGIALRELYSVMEDFIPEISVPVVINNIVSCTGADTCRLGIGLSKGLAKAIRKELLRSGLDLDRLKDVRLNISGCPNSCGQQIWGDIGFSGKVMRNDRIYPGYQLYFGASRKVNPKLAEAVGNINARDIPKLIVRIFACYLRVIDSYPSITPYLETAGRELALRLIEEYKTVPLFEDDKNYYFDWGAETIFSIVNRGAAECAAGLFDMINVDLNILSDRKKSLETETDKAKINKLLYDVVYSSSRMLLVTRGVESKAENDVFNLFIKNFIDYGFVEDRFRNIVTVARDNKDYDFSPVRDEVAALSDRIHELYDGMDDTLQFKNGKRAAVQAKEEEAAADQKVSSVDKFKDLRGVACPMNFVQTKIQLATMQAGQKLEIYLDDGQPIDNVPGSVRNEGHQILEQEQAGEGYWKVIIKKN